MVALPTAYAACERDAREHYENFPVASLLLGRAVRPHVAAIYAFARAADDFADEGGRSASERLALLERWGCRLRQAVEGTVEGTLHAGEPRNTVEIFTALGATIREKQLSPALFADLLSAFAQDVRVNRYATWAELFDYCRRSANPVGRLVLRVTGYRDERLDAWSDAVCTALQLTNFWQDLAIDFARGRIYLPLEQLQTHGAAEQDLSRESAPPALRAALRAAVARTRALFDTGRPVCDEVRGRLRYELRATWLGGVQILDRLAATGFDPLRQRPRLGASDVPRLAWRMVRWSA